MYLLKDKRVLVVGLGVSGRAAAQLLARRGARVVAVDAVDTPALRQAVEPLRLLEVELRLGTTAPPEAPFDLVVVSPGVPGEQRLMRELASRGVPIIGELELGYQQSRCLNVAISGTNGKTTTTELVERILTQAGRKTIAAGNIGLPLCAVADRTPELDFLTLEVSSFQLETIQFFRPAIAVLMNLTPDHLDRYADMADYLRAKARLFLNQQSFDWAIVQSEALAQLRALHLAIPSRLLTFSATQSQADLFLEGAFVSSRLKERPGPWLDLYQCQLRGPHNAENLMAALAVGHVLRLPLESVVEALKTYTPAPHRCEFVAEINGVKYINDSKATNLDAVCKAILSIGADSVGQPNIWLIAGGKDKGFGYDEIGPLLSQRVKGAFLIGETREKIRAAWNPFTPCQVADSLGDAVNMATQKARAGEVILLSPACSSFDQFNNYQHRGEVFRQAVLRQKNTTDSGCIPWRTQHNGADPNVPERRLCAAMI